MIVYTHYRLRANEPHPALLGIYLKGSYQIAYNIIADIAAKTGTKYPQSGTGAVCVKAHYLENDGVACIQWIEKTETK